MKMLKLERAFILSLFTLLAPTAMQAQESSETLVLNLEQAIAIGLSESPTIKVADLEVERVDYSRKEAVGMLFPTIGASADYSHALKKQVMYMDFDMSGMMGGDSTEGGEGTESAASTSSSSDGGMEIGRDHTWSGGFNFQLPLIAPTLWKNIKLTQADVENKLEAARSSKLTLVNEIESAYYNLILTQDSYEVLKKSYENAQIVAKDFEKKFEQGLASEYDVLRSQVQVRNQEPGLLQAENGVKLSALQLKVLIGMDMTVDVKAATNLDSYEGDMYEKTLSIDTSLDNNTNLRQLDLQTQYLDRALEVQRMSFYPTLSATGMYTWMAMANDYDFSNYRWTPYSTIGVSLQIPIFQGGSRYYKVKQAKLGIEQMGYQRDNLLKQLSMQVDAAMNNIQKAIKQIASNKEGIKQAEKAHDIMQKSFEVGMATFIELNDADLALTNSRLAYNQAIYDYLTAKSQLNLILGNADLNSYQATK